MKKQYFLDFTFNHSISDVPRCLSFHHYKNTEDGYFNCAFFSFILKSQPVLILNGQIAANRDKISPAQMFKGQICFDLNMQNQDQMITFPYDQIRLPFFLLIQFILPLIWSVAAALQRVADTYIQTGWQQAFPNLQKFYSKPCTIIAVCRAHLLLHRRSKYLRFKSISTKQNMKNTEKLERITTRKALMILRLHFENHDYKFLFEV